MLIFTCTYIQETKFQVNENFETVPEFVHNGLKQNVDSTVFVIKFGTSEM